MISVGESGLGKSTLINSLFLSDLYPDKKLPELKGNLNHDIAKTGARNGDDRLLLGCPGV